MPIPHEKFKRFFGLEILSFACLSGIAMGLIGFHRFLAGTVLFSLACIVVGIQLLIRWFEMPRWFPWKGPLIFITCVAVIWFDYYLVNVVADARDEYYSAQMSHGIPVLAITRSPLKEPGEKKEPPKIEKAPNKKQPINQELLTLKELFKTDFGSRMSSNEGTFPLIVTSKSGKFPDITYTFFARLYFDMDGGTQFFAFYIPRQDRDLDESSKKTVALCKQLPFQFPELLKQLHGLEAIEPHTRGSTLKSSELSFSRRVFIYHEDFITPPDLGDLVREYEAKQLLPEFRGDEYLSSQRLLRALGQRK